MDAGAQAVEPVAPATTPRCRLHPEDPEADDCDRCGAFACDACLSFYEQKYLCPDCTTRELEELPAIEPRADKARLFLLLMLILDAFALLPGVPALSGLLAIPTGILFLRWYVVMISLSNRLNVGPGVNNWSAVASWLLPFVGWVRPFDHMRQILKGLGTAWSGMTAWQLTWFASGVVSLMTLRASSPELDLAFATLDLCAAVLARNAVSELTSRLVEKRGARNVAPLGSQ